MPQLIEYRIPLPCTVEEYQTAQLYNVAKMSEAETTGEEGVEILKNEPYANEHEAGQYTYKVYHLGSKMPGWVAALLPKDLKTMNEEAWNAYPVCKTVISSPYFKEKFELKIESKHLPFNGHFEENVHNLPPEGLKHRKVEVIDIAFDEIDPKESPDDPKTYKSQKTGRGPLDSKDWALKANPCMCCYKLVTIKCLTALIGGKVENFLGGYERKLFQKFHRQLFCTTDEWFGKSMDDIRAMEEETRRKTAAKIEAEKAKKQGKH